MIGILIFILSIILAISAARLLKKKRLNEIEKNKKCTSITYDKYFIGVIGWMLILFLAVIMGMLLLLILGSTAYGAEEECLFCGLLLGLTFCGIMYVIAFLNLKSWEICLDQHELVHKKLFSTVVISYNELKDMTKNKKIIVGKGYFKIPGPNGYIKVNQAITSSGIYFREVLMEIVGLDDSALYNVEKIDLNKG